MNTDSEEELDRSRPDPIKGREHAKRAATKNQFHPLKLFTDNAWAARVWFLLSLALLGLVVVQPFFIIEAYRTRERVVIMDQAGTFSIAPTLDFEKATRLHEEMALWSTYALFSQNPNGFDMPELLDKMFLEEPLKAARKLQSSASKEFREKSIHQKVEVFEIKILLTREEEVFAQVKGQLIRTGSFEGKPFVEDPQFSLTLVMHRNPDMLANKRFPLAVISFEETILL
ncbi:hypothetical protein [Pelagicoccus sp. SDUM812002]|uniref:hypothetical protein n=1 Tax=Pelagicoccus sp. SDUM812002 TaxID=3041266 RepID=UPI00280EBEDD|nr:hypothetical protein [Pelagicoccus sp. SDUM812002]MDQ8184242.1 hypothetical protein [Pelagicoccus sp. SDUM812002]